MSQVYAAAAAGPTARGREATGRRATADGFVAVFENIREASRLRQAKGKFRERAAPGTGALEETSRRTPARQVDRSGSDEPAARTNRVRDAARSTADATPDPDRTALEVQDDGSQPGAEPQQVESTAAEIETAEPDNTETLDHAKHEQHENGAGSDPLPPEGTSLPGHAGQPASAPTAGCDGGHAGLLPDHAVSLPGTASPQIASLSQRVNSAETALQAGGTAASPQPAPAEAAVDGPGSAAASNRGLEHETKAGGSASSFQNVLSQAGRVAGVTAGTVSAEAPHGAAVPGDRTHVNLSHGPEELGRVLRSRVGMKQSSMVLQLDPPELGRVRVDVRMHLAVMTVCFQTETESGHDAIRSRLRELTAAIEQQGIRLDRVDVEYRPPPPDDAPPGDQPPWPPPGQQGGDSEAAGDREPPAGWNEPREPTPAIGAEDFSAESDPALRRGLNLVV